MKQVYQARDAAEAHFFRAELEARGIRAVVQGENLQLTAGEVPFFLATPTVHVNDEDEGRARAAVEELTRPRVTVGEPWQCPTCGETIDPQFTACWRCAGDEPVSDEHFLDRSETCRRCGYLLRGLPREGSCPECGAPYRRVREDDAGA